MGHAETETSVDGDGGHVRHYKYGVWDVYLQDEPRRTFLPSSWREQWDDYASAIENLPYLWRTIRDVSRTCGYWLLVHALGTVAQSLLPALSLWYSGQVLAVVQTAVDHRTVDKRLLLQSAGGHFLCDLALGLLSALLVTSSNRLNERIARHYDVYLFHAEARLDVPTYTDGVVQAQVDAASAPLANSVAWQAIDSCFHSVSVGLQAVSEALVLLGVLWGQRDGMLLAVLILLTRYTPWINSRSIIGSCKHWSATIHNKDFLRMKGLRLAISEYVYRQEIVAGSLTDRMTTQYREAVDRVGDLASTYWSFLTISRGGYTMLRRILEKPLHQLPQVAFALRAAQYPASIPVSLVSLNLIQNSAGTFIEKIRTLRYQAQSLSRNMSNLQKLYEVGNIPNQVLDGEKPFPEDSKTVRFGIGVEFRNVSFKYPGTEEYALRNASFKLEPGQLCVVVGANGSGKSTILKLVARLHDATDGEILIDGIDIKTLKLADLRRAMAILFQDYTHFPLSVGENIALGDPDATHNEEQIREAARLGGAEEVINRLPDGWETYLERPVSNLYSTHALPGDAKPPTHDAIRTPRRIHLSGGEMQRLALSRTFMRFAVGPASTDIGLLMFDEPSASLDPTAEHGSFFS
ncbi:P-loop containing nucleoside triphosphate hydrolase protein [Dentipellis sp. KUC8613]|nr:P-loop containing nucleoside triphosphate hydrolase protein [Dentipellis sp. KUC8613]